MATKNNKDEDLKKAIREELKVKDKKKKEPVTTVKTGTAQTILAKPAPATAGTTATGTTVLTPKPALAASEAGTKNNNWLKYIALLLGVLVLLYLFGDRRPANVVVYSPATANVQIGAGVPAPALAPALEKEEVSFSGNWEFDWGSGPSNFAIRSDGDGFYGEGIYDDGGKMTLRITRTGLSSFRGSWIITGKPDPNQNVSGSFTVENLSQNNGWGKWYHNFRSSSDLSIRRI